MSSLNMWTSGALLTRHGLAGYGSPRHLLDGRKLLHQANYAVLLPSHICWPGIQHLHLGSHRNFNPLVHIRRPIMAAVLRQEPQSRF